MEKNNNYKLVELTDYVDLDTARELEKQYLNKYINEIGFH